MPSSVNEPELTEPYGAALLNAVRELGLCNIGLDYETIQELKVADRAETIRILRSASAGLPYLVIQKLKKDTPEQVAEYFLAQYQIAVHSVPIWLMFTM